MNHSKVGISIMFCGNADGQMPEPYTVYKAKNMYPAWMQGGPPNARYGYSDLGWFEERSFEDWFFSLALPRLRRLDGKKVLIDDNLSSHLSVKVIEACKANDISFICLYPNGTHLLQPLDVSYFAPLKKAWKRVLGKWKLSPEGRQQVTLNKKQYPRLLAKLIAILASENGPENLKSGFRKCGLVPFEPEQVYKRLPSTASNELEPTEALDSSLLEALKELTGNNAELPKTKKVSKKNRLHLSPGRSVSLVEIPVATSTPQPIPSGADSPKSMKKPRSKTKKTRGRKKKNTVQDTVPDSNLVNHKSQDYVIVEYEGSSFPGQIISVDDNDGAVFYRVSCMQKYAGGKGWVLPEIADIEEYQEIKSTMKEPLVISTRNTGRYRVPELESIWEIDRLM